MCGYKKTLKENYKRIEKIESQIYSSKFGDIEYLLMGEDPKFLFLMVFQVLQRYDDSLFS
jgi:hypothetical protein